MKSFVNIKKLEKRVKELEIFTGVLLERLQILEAQINGGGGGGGGGIHGRFIFTQSNAKTSFPKLNTQQNNIPF